MIRFLDRYIHFPTALAGAVIMGFAVALINSDHGFWPAFTAALKQAVYTFLFGGMMIKLLFTLVTRIKMKFLAVAASSLAVSVLTIGLVYLVHSMKGTPKPFFSTLPTIVFAPPGFLILAWRKRSRSAMSNRQSPVR